MGELSEEATRIKSSISLELLVTQLTSDDEKLVFWINLYNAHVVRKFLRLGKQSSSFFTDKTLHLKDLSLSLDEIEHGILRRSTLKMSLGYFENPRATTTEKLLRVDQLDSRIHFALNCGANSCPPIHTFNLSDLSVDLERATKNYLSDSSVIDIENEVIKIPRLFLWYHGDFGGFNGIKRLYRRLELIPPDVQPRVKFLSYDWTMNIDNFATELSNV